MKIEQTYKIGYVDVDLNNTIRPRVLMKLFQDVATVHSEKVGFGYTSLKARGKAWVLYQMGIHVHRMPAVDDEIRIQSWHAKEDRLMASRDYLVTCGNGPLVSARGVWLMIDIQKNKLLRLTGENISEYYTVEPPIFDGPTFDAWNPSLMLELTHTCPIVLRPSDFDILGHVNNAVYFEYLEILIHEVLGDSVRFKSLHMQYSKEIPAGTREIQAGLQQREDRFAFKFFSGKMMHAIGDFQIA
ncbi:MAG: thioesterase [Desulfobacteraceae bacterium]|nr:thioesterase [Desulfobacteraceae bacterium]